MLTSIEPETLRRLLALADFYKRNPAEAFTPSPALVGFMTDESLRILVRAANRVGKTEHAAVKLSKLMLKLPKKRYRAVAVSYKQGVEVQSKLLHRYIPAEQLAPGCSYSETGGWMHSLIRLKNGTSCQIKSGDQAPIAHAGDDLDGVWCDEFPKPDIYQENLARVMSKKGWMWVTATPIGRPCGWFREIAEAKDTLWKQYLVEMSHRHCPWYTKEQVDAWIEEASTSPWSYKQRIMGDWEGEVLDRTFQGFSEDNISEEWRGDDNDFRLVIGIDHGELQGRQVALIILVTQNLVHIWDEVVNEERTTPEQDARQMVNCLRSHNWDISMVSKITGDINSAGKLGSGLKVNDLIAKYLASISRLKPGSVKIDIPYKAGGSVEWGETLLNAGFMRNQIFVHPRCKQLIMALRNYDGAGVEKNFIDPARYALAPILESWSLNQDNISRIKLT